MILEFLKSISNTSVMVIGDIILDRYLFGETNRKSPEAPIDIVDIKSEKEQVGGAANVALSFKKLNANVSLFGFVGNDSAGKKIISTIKKHKINSKILLTKNKTTLKTRIITSKKNHFCRFDIEKIDYKDSIKKKKLFKLIKSNIPKVDFLILQDYNKGLLDESMIKSILIEAKKYKKPVMVDPKEKNFTKYLSTKLIKPNLNEAKKFLKEEIKINTQSLKTACMKIQKKTKSEVVILTLGKRGLCILFNNKFHREYGIKNINPDVTGAGDNVICISSLAIFQKLPIKKIAELSNTTGALSCNKIGTNPINYNELITKLKKNT